MNRGSEQVLHDKKKHGAYILKQKTATNNTVWVSSTTMRAHYPRNTNMEIPAINLSAAHPPSILQLLSIPPTNTFHKDTDHCSFLILLETNF